MTKTSVALLDEALDAHGGVERWRQHRGIASTIVTGGKLWGLKGIDMDRTPRRATTEFHRQWTQVAPFGDPDWAMTWTPEHVQIADRAGNVIAERADGREAFGDRGFETPWDPLNLAYFNGYAMWTYHAVPFILAEPGYEVREIEAITQDNETLRGVAARFPAEVHTHTREQRFYFGSDGLLRRHDYEVNVWADSPAAHFVSDYVDVNGLKFPTRRTVFARKADGTPDLDFNTVTVELSDYELR